MDMHRISFKKALRQQIGFCIAALLIIIAMGYKLYPINTPYKSAVFLSFVVFTGALCLIWVRRATNQVLCNNCDTNLYHLIDGYGPVKFEVNYCPVCGSKVNT